MCFTIINHDCNKLKMNFLFLYKYHCESGVLLLMLSFSIIASSSNLNNVYTDITCNRIDTIVNDIYIVDVPLWFGFWISNCGHVDSFLSFNCFECFRCN